MQNSNYTRVEAEALVGKRFETLVEWDRVSKGMYGRAIWSSGRTVWSIKQPYECYEVVIAWDVPPGKSKSEDLPPQSSFSKFQVQKYMREVTK